MSSCVTVCQSDTPISSPSRSLASSILVMVSMDRTLPTRRWWSLVGLCGAAALVWLAFADLGVAVPTIAKELDCSLTELQWANNAFSLVTGALVLASGRFGDLFGRRRMLEVGIVLFALFSILAALAPG